MRGWRLIIDSTGQADPSIVDVLPPQGYYDATLSHPATYVFERARDGRGRDLAGTYLLKEQIAYVSRDGRSWTVPAEPGQRFSTDLASIPSFAAWLVPKDGTHTPAALIHDAMVLRPGERPSYAPGDPVIEREEADAIFREGMQHLGVRLVRRWLMWTAVSIPTLAARHGHFWLRRALLAPLVVFGVIGLLGVPDVFDLPGTWVVPDWLPGARGRVLAWHLHGVDEGMFAAELGRFATIALAASGAYAAAWSKRWRFGLVAGLGLSLLTVAMTVSAVTYALYRALEEAIALPLLLLAKRGRDTGRVRSSEWVEQLSEKL